MWRLTRMGINYLVLGFLAAILFSRIRRTPKSSSSPLKTVLDKARLQLSREEVKQRVRRYEQGKGSPKEYKFDFDHGQRYNDEAAANLYKKVRIVCWIMSHPDHFDTRVRHIKMTWGKRCNYFFAVSAVENRTYSVVALDVKEGRNHLTGKTMQAFKYCYDNYFDKADWFLKADDDTYVILENLRHFLSNKNTWEPVYYGHNFDSIVPGGYFSGGAGYVIGKEALKRFAEDGFGVDKICRIDGGAEDAEFGKCMFGLGIKAGESSDSLGRRRFHSFDPGTHLTGEYPSWYFKSDRHKGAKPILGLSRVNDSLAAILKDKNRNQLCIYTPYVTDWVSWFLGLSAISDYAISFHYITAQEMYAYEFYLYRLRPYGISVTKQEIN